MASAALFNGQLNTSIVYKSLYNMLISVQTYVDNISKTNSALVNMAKTEGSMYGDTILRTATDIVPIFDWLGDDEASNLLKLHRPQRPQQEKFVLDVFKMVPLTTDNFLSKQSWGDERAFAQFNSTVIAWMKDTRDIYEASIFNTFIGTNETNIGKQQLEIDVPAEPDGVDDYNTESYNRIYAQTIAMEMANLLVDLGDYSRSYNDFENLRSYNTDDLIFVWNSEYVNKITKMDTPNLFHKEGLVDKLGEYVLPARFFGKINATGGTTPSSNNSIRSLICKDYNTVEPSNAAYNKKLLIQAGDLLPSGVAYGANETYTNDDTIAFKVYHKDSVPFLSAFNASSEFFNPRSQTSTKYLIFAHNHLAHSNNYPFITARVKHAAV